MADTDPNVLPADNQSLPNGDAKEEKKEFFKVATEPPEWLNREYLEKAFREYENDQSLQIFECEIIPAAKPGDNFASVVFRANVKYTCKAKTESLSIIMKVKPFIEGIWKDMLQDMPLFKTEVDMYTKILPEMQRLLTQLGEKEPICPNLIYHSTNPDIIILEDIAPQGFVMRHQQLNFENTQKVIQKLAQFHALSYYLYHEENKDLNVMKDGLVTTASINNFKFFLDAFTIAGKCVKEWEGYNEIGEKLEKLVPLFMKKLREVYIPNKPNEGFNVLNHGDFHIKNLLFVNGDNDNIEKVTFIDYQISVWASPAIDINYVMYCHASEDARDNHREELIRSYHTKFCSVLEQLGCLKRPPSLLELNIEMLKHGFLEIILSIQFMAMFYVNVEEMIKSGVDMNDMDALLKQLYMESNMRPVLEKLFIRFLHNGYLEV